MNRRKPPTPPGRHAASPDSLSLHRSGAVARMLRMPVATLRIWERRYGLTQAAQSPSGHRLYSADDVRRLALVKQLTDVGHAIGSLAPLDMTQLQRVAATHAQALAGTQRAAQPDAARAAPRPAWRLAVVGRALWSRLHRPALKRRLAASVTLLGPFEDAAHAAAALQPTDVDALLLHEPQLQAGWRADIDAAAPGLADVPRAVLFGFAPEPVCNALADAGTALLREPQPDAALAQWLQILCAAARLPATTLDGTALAALPLPPRRWDDAALVDFAGLSSTVACECPRHVAELLMQLSHFEAYSADCAHRSAADAALHACLQQVAAASRARFELALEHVALHEGLMLPPTSPPADAARKPGRQTVKTASAPASRRRA